MEWNARLDPSLFAMSNWRGRRWSEAAAVEGGGIQSNITSDKFNYTMENHEIEKIHR
jgi:hypothetical protein